MKKAEPRRTCYEFIWVGMGVMVSWTNASQYDVCQHDGCSGNAHAWDDDAWYDASWDAKPPHDDDLPDYLMGHTGPYRKSRKIIERTNLFMKSGLGAYF